MHSRTIEGISENIFQVMRLIYKKLLRVDFQSAADGITYLHFLIMNMLARIGSAPISEVGRRLMIPRPQMTHLIDQLIKLDIVVRHHCEEDRRIIYVELTDSGREVLKKCNKLLKDNVKAKLVHLDGRELNELSALLLKLKEITEKLS